MYNIYKFQENRRTFLSSLSLHFSLSLSLHIKTSRDSLSLHFQLTSTERGRLAQGGYRGQGFGTERARLAQGGFLGQFYKRNPFKRHF